MAKRMILRSTLSLALAVLVGTLLPAAARAQSRDSSASSGCKVYDVTTMLNNTDNNNLAFQFQSDGLGTYTAISPGRNGSVKSVIDGTCEWSLDTTVSESREFAVTLAYPVSSGYTAPFIGPQLVKGRMNTHCTRNTENNGLALGSMTTFGQTLICPINVAFYYGSTWYNIGVNPFNWPGTTMAQVTCSGASSGHCNAWTIVPDPATSPTNPATNQLSSIGELTLPPCVGCSGGTPLGEYYLAYSFVIHK